MSMELSLFVKVNLIVLIEGTNALKNKVPLLVLMCLELLRIHLIQTCTDNSAYPRQHVAVVLLSY